MLELRDEKCSNRYLFAKYGTLFFIVTVYILFPLGKVYSFEMVRLFDKLWRVNLENYRGICPYGLVQRVSISA